MTGIISITSSLLMICSIRLPMAACIAQSHHNTHLVHLVHNTESGMVMSENRKRECSGLANNQTKPQGTQGESSTSIKRKG